MNADEKSIREVLTRWHAATAEGDVDSVLELMSEDAIFLVPGQPPMRGRQEFGTRLRKILQTHRIDSSGEVQEIAVSGDLAYCWAVLEVKVIPLAGGEAIERSGNALSIFRRQADGSWVLVRDANLIAAIG
jgi:uncharacterized protein (TIGR02246 family)